MSGLASTRFAVLDVETTGFNAGGHDRIIEIAVVHLEPDGSDGEEFATLINPGRDLGPTHVHGLRAADILEAPKFGEIAGEILDRLDGAVLVGHNVRFDEAFLVAELARIAVALPGPTSLCTLALTMRLELPAESRRLADCCAACGIEHGMAHSALDDARATRALLRTYLAFARERGWSDLVSLGAHVPKASGPWPRLDTTARPVTRREAQARAETEIPYLARLVQSLPTTPGNSGDVASYLATLDRALEDRRLSVAEGEALRSIAADYGLTRDAIVRAHEAYFAGLVDAALADGTVTRSEAEDLASVARMLALPAARLDEELATARARSSAPSGATPAPVHPASPSRQALEGTSVCFTGELRASIRGVPVTREQAEQLAREAGMAVASGVTKKLGMLVVADPDSLSGKAKKARDYGLRIVAEMAFWRMLGVTVD